MSSSTKYVTLVGLLCIAAQAAAIQTFSKNFKMPFTSPLLRISENIDQNLVYLTCNEAENRNVANCHFEMKMIDGIEKSCDVQLELPKTNDINFDIIDANLKSMYGGKKAVFHWSWGSWDNRKMVTLVDMDTCKIVNLSFSIDSHPIDKQQKMRRPNFHLLAYDNSFLVAIDSKTNCSEQIKSPCILQYNHEGELFGQAKLPSKYYEEGHSIVVNRHRSFTGGYFMTLKRNATGGSINVSHISYNSIETIMFKNLYRPREFLKYDSVESNENGHFAMCYLDTVDDEVVVSCIQSTANGQKKVYKSVTNFSKAQQVMLKVVNRRQGGILFMYIDCSTSNVDKMCDKAKINFVEVAGNGAVIRNVEMIELGSPYGEIQELSINHAETDTEHCFYFAYSHEPRGTGKTIINYFQNCVDKTFGNS